MTMLKRLVLSSLVMCPALPLVSAPKPTVDEINAKVNAINSEIATLKNGTGKLDVVTRDMIALGAAMGTYGTTPAPVNPAVQPFFTLSVPQEAQDMAIALGTITFMKWTAKDVTVCRSSAINGSAHASKYVKLNGALTQVKSEEYFGRADGFTKCVHKGYNARAAVPLAETTARILQATASPTDMTQVKFIDLYNHYTPIWLQAKSANEVREFVEMAQMDLMSATVDPTVRPKDYRQALIITIENDPLLSSLDENLINELGDIFSVGSMANNTLREFISEEKAALIELLAENKKALDINPSFLEGLFEDLNEQNFYFNPKLMARDVLKNIFTLKHISQKLTGFGLGLLAVYMWKKWTEKKKEEGPEKLSEQNKLLVAALSEAIKKPATA